MAENIQNQFKCSGDCLSCRLNPVERKTQWQYCAAQFSYNALRTMQTMQEALNLMSGEISEMKAKIEAIQNSEATVYVPNADVVTEPEKEEVSGIPINQIAHLGSGA